MARDFSKPAILSTTLRFLTAGGLTLAVAVWQEIARENTDWNQVLTLVAGILVGIGGGVYGRLKATTTISSLVGR